MALELVSLSLQAHDPPRLARFWAAALRWDVVDDPDGAAHLVPTDGTRFRMDVRPGAVAKAGPNRIHLDLTTASLGDQQESVDALLALGARHLDIGQGPEDEQVVLADPEDNELCVIEPTNRFLGDCGRLGAVSCDGTQAVGYFWSAALGWPLVWDQDEETAIRAPDGTGPIISWGGPPVAPQRGRSRFHLELVPAGSSDVATEVARLESLGADRAGLDHGDPDWVGLTDPDGNPFCVRPSPA